VPSRERLALSVHSSVMQSRKRCQVRKHMRSPCLGSTVASGCYSMPAMRTLSEANAGVTQLVEYLPSKQAVASSSLVPRSTKSA
jgi:hypothetical protein